MMKRRTVNSNTTSKLADKPVSENPSLLSDELVAVGNNDSGTRGTGILYYGQ